MSPSKTFLLAAFCVCAACGSTGLQEPERARARTSREPEPELSLGPIALLDPEREEPLISLREDGVVEHSSCSLRLETSGEARNEREELVLRIEGDTILGGDGRALYRLEQTQLIRGDGERATLEGERIVFGNADALSLRVMGADEPAMKRAALVLFALMAVCGR